MKKTFKETIYFDLTNRSSKLGRLIEIILLILNISLCTLFVLDSHFPQYHSLFNIIDTIVVLFLILEFILRIYASPNRRRHITHFLTIIDFLSILPTVIGWFVPVSSVGFLTTLRILRLFRVLRFLRFLETRDFFFGTVAEQVLRIIRLFSIIGMLFFFSAGVLYSIEAPFNDKMNTFGDAFYFAVMTLTTVGFGDITPITHAGRTFTIIMVLAGVVIIPWQAGQVIRGATKKQITCSCCGQNLYDNDAQFCKSCGTKINHN